MCELSTTGVKSCPSAARACRQWSAAQLKELIRPRPRQSWQTYVVFMQSSQHKAFKLLTPAPEAATGGAALQPLRARQLAKSSHWCMWLHPGSNPNDLSEPASCSLLKRLCCPMLRQGLSMSFEVGVAM